MQTASSAPRKGALTRALSAPGTANGLILLGAVGYMAVQNYLVYDEAGQVHLELPFGHRGQEEQTDKPPVENVDIDRLEPEIKAYIQAMLASGSMTLDELIADNEAQYIATAVALANDLPRLRALRKGLRERVAASPLMNAPRFALHFGQALQAMWAQREER